MESRFSKSCEGEFTKKSSLAILRGQERAYKSRVKREGKMMRMKKHLKEQIYSNSNIFQVPDMKFSRKAAQNMIWEKNYKLKMSINILREENSSLKAKLWNIEK
jgi:muconolactone delta-isomerase